MKKQTGFISAICIICLINGCCKEKAKDEGCKSQNFQVIPFSENFYQFFCYNGDLPYQYICWNREQIDSLQHVCGWANTAVYPLNHLPNLYMVTADTIFNYTDTITGEVFIDTCKKEVNYNVKFVQRSKNPLQYPGIASIFCIVENVTPDYKVNVNKERIWLP